MGYVVGGPTLGGRDPTPYGSCASPDGGIFVPLALTVGFAVGAPGPFAAVAVLGLLNILVLGYAYVGFAVLLRLGLGPRQLT